MVNIENSTIAITGGSAGRIAIMPVKPARVVKLCMEPVEKRVAPVPPSLEPVHTRIGNSYNKSIR